MRRDVGKDMRGVGKCVGKVRGDVERGVGECVG